MDDASLLLRIKGDSSGGTKAVAEARTAIASLRSTASKELGAMQSVATRSLGAVTQNLTQLTSQLPVVGSAVGSLSSQFGALASPAGIATIATLALAGGLASLGVKLFQVVEQSSQLGGQIHDLTLQTGLSAERLTALKFAADQSGGSIEQLANGLKIFSTLIVNANKGSEEATATLKRLGVEPKEGLIDLDSALNKAFQTIAKTPAGVAQMTLAADAFGKKIGPDLIPTIVSFDGNLDALTKRARELGVTLTDVQVKSLDEFGDAFDTIKLQATLAAAQFSSAVAPEITLAMMSITRSVGGSRGAFEQWGIAVGDTLRGVRLIAESELGTVIRMLTEMSFLLPLTVLRGLRALGESQRPATAGEDFFGPGGAARGGRASLPGTPEAREAAERRAKLEQFQSELAKSGRGGGKAKAKTDTALQAALKDAALAEKETLQQLQANVAENQRALDEQVRSIEDYTERAIKLADDRFNAVVDRTNAEAEALQAALKKKLITQEEFDRKWREQGVEVEDARQKNSNETFQLEQERDRKIATAEQASRERRLQIAEEADQRQIDRVIRRIDREVTAESEGLREISTIIAEAFQRKKEALEAEQAAYSTTLERRAAITDELVRLEGERAGAAEKASQRVIDATEREARARFDAESKGFQDATRPRRTIDPILEKGPFGSLSDELSKAGVVSRETADIVGGTLAGAFQSLASGVGQAVQSFLLFGKVEGGFKRLAAEIVSSLAAAAVVQAIYQLAQGLAWLALNAFFPNPKYVEAAGLAFASAAVFGTIGAAASVASIALRSSPASSSASSGGRASEGGSAASGKPATIEADRRSGAGSSNVSIEAAIERAIGRGFNGLMLRAEVTRDEGSTVKMWVDNYRSNGIVRKVVNEDGG